MTTFTRRASPQQAKQYLLPSAFDSLFAFTCSPTWRPRLTRSTSTKAIYHPWKLKEQHLRSVCSRNSWREGQPGKRHLLLWDYHSHTALPCNSELTQQPESTSQHSSSTAESQTTVITTPNTTHWSGPKHLPPLYNRSPMRYRRSLNRLKTDAT